MSEAKNKHKNKTIENQNKQIKDKTQRAIEAIEKRRRHLEYLKH